MRRAGPERLDQAVEADRAVEAAFDGAADAYRAQGLVGLRPEVRPSSR